jgi:hypothetical protein
MASRQHTVPFQAQASTLGSVVVVAAIALVTDFVYKVLCRFGSVGSRLVSRYHVMIVETFASVVVVLVAAAAVVVDHTTRASSFDDGNKGIFHSRSRRGRGG